MNLDNPQPIKLAIWGAGGHALVVADIVRSDTRFEIIGFLDDFASDRYGQPFAGSTVLGGKALLPRLGSVGITHAILAFGNCAARLKLADELIAAGLRLATAIHPKATVAQDVSIGEGSMIIAGAVINPGARIGRNVIVNTCASVDHECTVDDGAHICPGVRLGGNVRVGRGAWVGIGAAVLPGVTIGDGAVIGAGAVVLKNVPAGVTAYGCPQKFDERARTHERWKRIDRNGRDR